MIASSYNYEIALAEDLVIFSTRRWKLYMHMAQTLFPFLKPETYEKASVAAPGWDIHMLAEQWREWITKKKESPKRPDAAFVALCRKKFASQIR